MCPQVEGCARREERGKKVWLIHKLWTDCDSFTGWGRKRWESSGWSRDKRGQEGWLMLKGGYAWLARPFCFLFFWLSTYSICLALNCSETWILSRLLLSCLSLNMSLDKDSHVSLHAPNCISLHCTCRQKQQPITLSPEPTQRQQHYLVWWLSKCSL